MSENRKALVFTGAEFNDSDEYKLCTDDPALECHFAADHKTLAKLLKKYEFGLLMVDNAVAADSDQFQELMSVASDYNLPVVVTRVAAGIGKEQADQRVHPEPLFKRLVLRRNQPEAAYDESDRLNIVSETAATLSHEINNPLMAITANVEMLLRKKRELDPGTLEKVSAIKHAAERIRTVTHQLTDLETLKFRQTAAGRMIEIEEVVNRKDLTLSGKTSKNDEQKS